MSSTIRLLSISPPPPIFPKCVLESRPSYKYRGEGVSESEPPATIRPTPCARNNQSPHVQQLPTLKDHSPKWSDSWLGRGHFVHVLQSLLNLTQTKWSDSWLGRGHFVHVLQSLLNLTQTKHKVYTNLNLEIVKYFCLNPKTHKAASVACQRCNHLQLRLVPSYRVRVNTLKKCKHMLECNYNTVIQQLLRSSSCYNRKQCGEHL